MNMPIQMVINTKKKFIRVMDLKVFGGQRQSFCRCDMEVRSECQKEPVTGKERDSQKESPKGGNGLGEFGEQKGGQYDRAQGERSC